MSKRSTTSHQGHAVFGQLIRHKKKSGRRCQTQYRDDSLGRVTNGVKYFADGTLVPGQQFGYLFDDIGNRKQTTAGGDANGSSPSKRLASYTVNTLNQITQRDYPGTNDVIGAALATNAVTVNGQTAWHKGEYFWSTVISNNTTAAQWEGIKVASGGATNTGYLYAPKTPEIFKYEADGNLTNDGRWAYTWDAENRLIGMTVNTNVGPQYQLTFAYDAKGRRIQKVVSTNGVALSTNNFLYDGWNLIAETRPDNSLIRSYVWGTDLSGTSQGAGGVGGLLQISYYGSPTTNCFPAFDGNGNIMALLNAADGTLAANYDYGAFGEPIRITGVMARNNPFRFSTKYADDESDLLYYGYRYYKPSTGTWQNRDPIEEQGGLDLYEFCGDDAIGNYDSLGLTLSDQVPKPSPWRWKFPIQNPGPSQTHAVTSASFQLVIKAIDRSGCCCRLKDASYTVDILTEFLGDKWNEDTFRHEGVHAWADWQMGKYAMDTWIAQHKRCCIPQYIDSDKACRKALQASLDNLLKQLNDLANTPSSIIGTTAHSDIGSVGWNQAGEDQFTQWFNSWLPSSFPGGSKDTKPFHCRDLK